MPYPRDEFPLELRTYRCDGSHGLTHERFVHDTDPDGSQIELTVVYCADETCAQITRTRCHHASNSWKWVPGYAPDERPPGVDLLGDEAASALLCDFCGADGT